MDWHSIKKEEVIRKLNSNIEGLNEVEARKRLEKYGKNEIKEVYTLSPLKIFIRQFQSFIIYILLAAIIVSIIIQHYIDMSVILAIVLLNAVIGFIQQYKAEKSIIELRKLFIPKSKVFREGKLKIISSQYLVPGDIVLFEEGDKVTADSRILNTTNLEVNEAILTGESMPIEKLDTIIKLDGLLSEKLNILFAGTTIVRGNVKAILTETGMNTEFGKIALKLQEISLPATPMQKKLDRFAKQVSIAVLILAILTFFLGIAEGREKIEMFLTSIALIVSVIPEGLPAIITISLALATNRMLKNNVLIRRLPAAETLGSVTVICSDKTGTMTEERMYVTDVFCNNKFFRNTSKGLLLGNKIASLQKEKELLRLIKTSILSSNARFEELSNQQFQIIGDPTEAAFVSFALELGIDKKLLTEIEPRIKEISFSSERKMMSILRRSIRRNVLYAKGSPSSILAKSSFEVREGNIIRLNDRKKKELLKIAEDLERKGLRVMAFAFKYARDEAEEEALTFLGFLGLLDPPRKEVKNAIEECKKAGIKVKMITGDSLLTAKNIASRIGIEGKIIGGRELEEMSDEDLLEEIDKIVIFARTEPKQKLRIVEILKRKGEQVAITGDGINDILALRKADIGIAMGKRGSDIARDVSDMILLDDNFVNIVKGVEEGRVVYDNSKKATKFLLASNFVELLLIAYSILFNLPLPLLPLQILWVNLVTDSPPALALTKEKGEDVMEKPRKEKSLLDGIFWFVIAAGLVSVIPALLIFHYGLAYLSIEKARTMIMFSVIGFEMFFVFTCRSNKSLRETGFFSNKYILYSILSVIAINLILILTPLAPIFSLTKLSLFEWFLVLLASLPGLIVFETWKILKRK